MVVVQKCARGSILEQPIHNISDRYSVSRDPLFRDNLDELCEVVGDDEEG